MSLRTSCQSDPCLQKSPPLSLGAKTGSATSITTVSPPACALCCSCPPLYLKKSDGLLRYAVVPPHFSCSPLLLCCPGIILNTISGLSQCSVRLSIFMKYTNNYSYCRWSSVSYVSVNETMPHLSSGLDGSTSASERERLINQFNDPENNAAWVFLLSTRYRPLLYFFP